MLKFQKPLCIKLFIIMICINIHVLPLQLELFILVILYANFLKNGHKNYN